MIIMKQKQYCSEKAISIKSIPLILLLPITDNPQINQLHKYIFMQAKTLDTKQIRQQVKTKLEFINIYKETSILTHMNRCLQIDLKWFKKWELLNNRNEQQIITILTSIPFLKYKEDNSANSCRKFIQLAYNLSPHYLIVTGIYDDCLTMLLNNFTNNQKKHQYTKNQIKKIAHNQYYTLIDPSSKENADLLRGYLRNQKKRLEDRTNYQFKFQHRKVRIVLIQQQDLFTFLTDIMSQYKCEQFMRSMAQNNDRCKSPNLRNAPSKIIYTPFFINGLQIGQKPKHQIIPRKIPQKEETSMVSKKVKHGQEDQSSESTSLNSQMPQGKLQDIPGQQPDKVNEMCFLGDQNLKGGFNDEVCIQ